MLYNEGNTNVEIIRKNYRELEDDKKANENCVLLTTGSFNPIHHSHIDNLLQVKHRLESQIPPMNVLAAYISPTHGNYVRGKLGGSDFISDESRCQLCQEAIRESDLESLITVSQGEIESPAGFVDFDEVTRNLASFLNFELKKDQLTIKVVYVCGLDHFNKCPYVTQLAREENTACAVIYRPNASEAHIKSFLKPSSNVYYIALEEKRPTLIDISSTAIRKLHRTGDYAAMNQLTYSCVSDYYQSKTSKNQS